MELIREIPNSKPVGAHPPANQGTNSGTATLACQRSGFRVQGFRLRVPDVCEVASDAPERCENILFTRECLRSMPLALTPQLSPKTLNPDT